MKELRLDYFLMRGGLLAVGDKCFDEDGAEAVIDDCYVADSWNAIQAGNDICFIQLFAPRENKGVQHVPDDFPVILVFRDCSIDCSFGGRFIWEITEEQDDIMEWKPDIEKLIEQQAQYDFEQGKALSPQVEAGIDQIAKQLKGSSNKIKMAAKYRNKIKILKAEVTRMHKTISELKADNKSLREKQEREKAEEDLITEVVQVLSSAMLNENPFTDTANELKERGLLKEITLPLK